MKFNKKLLSGVLAALMAGSMLSGCGSSAAPASSAAAADTSKAQEAPASSVAESVSGESSLKGERVRVVIGSTSTSGDSYMVADIVTRYLAKEMGFNGKVDGIGNARALEEISKAKGDGTTIMMFHDMTFMSVLFGAVDEKYALENLTVGPRIGQNPGACFGAKADAPYNTLKEMSEWLKANPDKEVRINIEAGGTSHIGFVAYWLWAKETYGEEVTNRIRVIVGGTTAEKLQVLWDGNADVIFGDYSAFKQYTEDGVEAQLKMKIMDPLDKIAGIDIKTIAEDGITFKGKPFVFSKDFAMYFPKEMDPAILSEIEAAMKKVANNPDFQKEMADMTYKTVDMNVADSQFFIYDKRELCKELIAVAPNLDDVTVK
ncbi:tripartite tricarboxylate transporter substrate-binding protein [Oscillospiraceae bacterium PP1C4]